MKKICFAGGGTGGHIYPALAIIFALREADEKSGAHPDGKIEIFWIGQKNGMDRQIVEDAGVRFFGISAGKLRRYFSLKNLLDIFKIAAGFFAARRILRRECPTLLFSKGGFVSVPPVIAAASLGIPVHTHESDFSAGLATRINARFATRIWLASAETAGFFSDKLKQRCRVCGNPVRPAFRAAALAGGAQGRAALERLSGKKIPEQKKILLVLGGSQGAQEVNELVRGSISCLTRHFFVVHQTGCAAETASADSDADSYFPVKYIKAEMPAILAAASLVLGRSGAGTVWESAAAGVPMILIPLAGSGTRGDQVENARYFERQGAALTLIHPSGTELEAAVEALVSDETRLDAMAAASRKAGALDAVSIIKEELNAAL